MWFPPPWGNFETIATLQQWARQPGVQKLNDGWVAGIAEKFLSDYQGAVLAFAQTKWKTRTPTSSQSAARAWEAATRAVDFKAMSCLAEADCDSAAKTINRELTRALLYSLKAVLAAPVIEPDTLGLLGFMRWVSGLCDVGQRELERGWWHTHTHTSEPHTATFTQRTGSISESRKLGFVTQFVSTDCKS